MLTLKLSEKNDESIQGANIGSILLSSGRLTSQDMTRIVALQEKEQILFGDAAVALGILTDEDIRVALACQYSYPTIEAEGSSVSGELLVLREPFGTRVECFRSIRSGLLLMGAGSLIKTIAVLSPEEGEGRTFVAANLAVVFAQLGSRTILVDLNFRKPRVHEIFQIKNNTGASSLIIKRALFENAIQNTSIDSLDILPSGPKPPNPLELLSWQDTRNLVASLKEKYDIVIIDTPAFSKTADAMHIAALCDGSVVVALKGKTKLGPFGQLKKQMDAAGCKILGSIVNEMQIGKKK
jgi:protein-tyrosine kinase